MTRKVFLVVAQTQGFETGYKVVTAEKSYLKAQLKQFTCAISETNTLTKEHTGVEIVKKKGAVCVLVNGELSTAYFVIKIKGF